MIVATCDHALIRRETKPRLDELLLAGKKERLEHAQQTSDLVLSAFCILLIILSFI
jgi:hypothetical protein